MCLNTVLSGGVFPTQDTLRMKKARVSPKQGLSSAKDLTLMYSKWRESPYHRPD